MVRIKGSDVEISIGGIELPSLPVAVLVPSEVPIRGVVEFEILDAAPVAEFIRKVLERVIADEREYREQLDRWADDGGTIP